VQGEHLNSGKQYYNRDAYVKGVQTDSLDLGVFI
jgi:hypothetical protein